MSEQVNYDSVILWPRQGMWILIKCLVSSNWEGILFQMADYIYRNKFKRPQENNWVIWCNSSTLHNI